MSFSKRQGNDAVCYTKSLDSLKSWNDRFFWVDAFACPASFPWNTSKSASKDPFPKSSQYNAEHYATLVAYPAPFHKYPEPFLCLIGISRNYTLDEDAYPQFLRDNDKEMDLLSFIRTADPTKVRAGERQRAKGEPKLLDTTVGRVVPLLPVAPARASSELEANVDMLFDEGGGGSHAEQGDSASGGHGVGIPQVSETAEIVAEDAAPMQPMRKRKRKTVVSDAGKPSHLPKKLREDHETSTGPFVAGKSKSALQRLLVGAVLNPKVGVAALPTLPFYYFFCANIAEAEADSFARPSVPLMTIVTSTVDPTTTAKEKFAESSIFGGNSSSGAEHTVGGFFGLTGSDFIVGGIRTVVSPDTDLQKVYVPQWSVTNGSCLDDGCTCREMVDEFAPSKFFASIRGMEHDELFTEFNVGAAHQISLKAEVRIRDEFNIKEKRRLGAAVEEKNSLLEARDEEVANRNTVLEREKSELYVKVADLTATVRVREQEVADLDAVVTSVKVHNETLSDQVHTLEVSSAGLQEKVTAYENFIGQFEKFQDDRMREMNENFDKLDTDLYLSSLGVAIGKAVEKGMQEGLSARITHELKSNKDASIDTIMNLLRLEDSLAERLGLTESQPHVDGSHTSFPGSTCRWCFCFITFVRCLQFPTLTGTEVISAPIDTASVRSTTLASVSTIVPISIKDYEVACTDGQEAVNESVPNDATGGSVNPFPNVDDVELNVS
ncbi:hypothetical protein Tco_0328088 [Tanacetum coccineum]